MITRRFPRLFLQQVLRIVARHPVLFILNLLGIALGVSVFLAIQIANRSATESLSAGIDLVAGRANLEVRGTFDETLFPHIAHLDGVRAATPLVESVVSLARHPGEYLRLIGIDPFSGDELRTFELLGADRAKIDLQTWLSMPDAIAISPDYATRILPRIGNSITVRANGREQPLRPLFVLAPATATGDPRIAAMDIGWAQELLHRQGQLNAILLLVVPEKIDAVTRAIRSLVPADTTVAPPAQRSRQIETMLAAFQLNLTALSLVSILIGAFLIYNTISASVVRRRGEIGILRAVGASRAEIRLLFLGEAAFFGFIGSVAGWLLALPLASALTAPISQTIRSLYILTSVERLYLSPWQFAEALAVGFGAALLAAWVPANEAACATPAQALYPGAPPSTSTKTHFTWPTIVALALLACAAIFGWATLALQLPLLGFASALSVLAGFSLLVPAAIRMASHTFRHCSPFLRIVAANLDHSRTRGVVTIAALAAAIGLSVSVAVMIHSFRCSVDEWIESTLSGDLFIGVADPDTGASLPSGAERWLRKEPAAHHLSTRANTILSFHKEPIETAVLDGIDRRALRFIDTDSARSFRDFESEDCVIVSEPFSNRFGVHVGDRIELTSPSGPVTFRVVGVFQDYARSNGLIMIQRKNFERYWPPIPIQSISLEIDPAQAENLERAFRQEFGRTEAITIYSNRTLKKKIFEIFDQTFAVTIVLRAIAVTVAAVGVTLALLILGAERERELGVLRALGASRPQLVGLFLREAALIGLIASLVGIASGASLAVVLTGVVNKAFFGWTISLRYPFDTIISTPLWIIPTAMLAALLPAWQAVSKKPARAIRFE